jgi:uncharacterized membrane protein
LYYSAVLSGTNNSVLTITNNNGSCDDLNFPNITITNNGYTTNIEENICCITKNYSDDGTD